MRPEAIRRLIGQAATSQAKTRRARRHRGAKLPDWLAEKLGAGERIEPNTMPRDGATTFGDLVGRLEALRVWLCAAACLRTATRFVPDDGNRARQFCYFDHPIRDLAGATLGVIGDGAQLCRQADILEGIRPWRGRTGR